MRKPREKKVTDDIRKAKKLILHDDKRTVELEYGKGKHQKMYVIKSQDLWARTKEDAEFIYGKYLHDAFNSENVFARMRALENILNWAGMPLTSRSVQIHRREEKGKKFVDVRQELAENIAGFVERYGTDDLPKQFQEILQEAKRLVSGTKRQDEKNAGDLPEI